MLRIAREHPFVSVVVATILPGILAAIAEYIITDGVSGTIPIVTASIGGGGTMIVLLLLGKSTLSEQPHPVSQLVQEGTAPRTAGRVYSPRTPTDLVSAIQGMTEIMAERHIEPHLGQWLRVSGTVNDVSARSDKMSVWLQKTDSQPALVLYFRAKEWESRLIVLNPGDMIKAEGKIDRVASNHVRLDECELIG